MNREREREMDIKRDDGLSGEGLTLGHEAVDWTT